jgi:hypothetical protein
MRSFRKADPGRVDKTPKMPLGDFPTVFNPPWEVGEFQGMAVIYLAAGLRRSGFALLRHEAKKLVHELAELADALPPTPTHAVPPPNPPRAATAVTFKHEDVNDDGEPIGPVFVSGDDGIPIFEFDWPGSLWLTLSQARAFAQEHGLSFDED